MRTRVGAPLAAVVLREGRTAGERILGLPRSVTPCAVVPIGWPIGKYGPTTRRPVEDVVSIDRWGNRAWRRGQV